MAKFQNVFVMLVKTVFTFRTFQNGSQLYKAYFQVILRSLVPPYYQAIGPLEPTLHNRAHKCRQIPSSIILNPITLQIFFTGYN